MVQGGGPLSGHAPVRLAFTYIPRRLWAGGYNYQRNLFAALHRYRPSEFAPVIFAGTTGNSDDLEGLSAIPGVEVVQTHGFDQRTSGLAMALASGLDHAAVAAFRKQNIDVVVETARFFGWRLPYPAVAWFPDFQHRRLPQLFSSMARWRRDIGFRVQIASGRTIMLSSESSLRDCEAFYPAVAGRASVVRFASLPSTELLSADPRKIIEQYKLPERFFFLPNQFWRHKNHQVVIDALDVLRSRGSDVVIAASGSNDDPREPGYFDSIMSQIYERNLSHNFRYVGMIPLSHVYALLRASVALINPSRFEGWSTTVEEAKSFGVPMILSDLDVHREQTEGMAMYFGTDDPTSLADHLFGTAHNSETCFVRNLVPGLEERVSLFAADFAHTICGAIASRQSV
jgi:glycosyltransferase involved in cell wall biosynthesis